MIKIKSYLDVLEESSMAIFKESSPEYFVIIPAHISQDERLTWFEKHLYGDFYAATSAGQRETFKGNKYFADLYKITEVTVSRAVNNLKKYGYINTRIEHMTHSGRKRRYTSMVVE